MFVRLHVHIQIDSVDRGHQHAKKHPAPRSTQAQRLNTKLKLSPYTHNLLYLYQSHHQTNEWIYINDKYQYI